MATIPIRNRSGKGGIIWDTPPNELPPNAWSAGQNVRFFSNRLERMGGYKKTFDVVDGRALWGLWRQGNRELLLITATQMLISQDGSTFPVDVTPTVMTDADDWIATQYGDWVILTSNFTTPLVLDPAGVQFVPFTNWPATYRAHKITPYQGFLVAVGIEIAGLQQSAMVKWSDNVDLSDIVNVEWDPTLTNLAREFVIPSSDGVIRDFGQLHDAGILYLDNSVWRMDPSAARPLGVSEVFRFQLVFGNDDGIIGERAFTEVEGLHYVIGKHDIYVHDGHTRKTISDDRATEYFFESLGSETVAYVEHFIEKQEVLFVFARQDQKYASEGLIYSYLYDAWTSLRIDDAQGGDTGAFSHITRGPFSASGGPVTYDDLAATSYDDLAATSYDDLFPRSTKLDLYGLAPDLGGVYVFNQSPDTADFSPSLFLERIDYDLDEFFEVTASIKYWDRTIPLISGSGQVKFRFGGRNVLSEGIKWGVEKVYNVGTDWKIDHRTTYRYPAIQMIQDDNGSISMTGADLSVKAAHGR